MNWIVAIYSAILFFILTPNILVRLPPKSGKYVVAATHALIFALVFHFTCKIIWMTSMSMGLHGFREGVTAPTKEKLENEAEKLAQQSTQLANQSKALADKATAAVQQANARVQPTTR
jgi:hypothetical protein